MKGSMFDVLIIAITLFVLAVGILVASLVMTNIQSSTSSVLTATESQNALTQGVAAINTFNYGFVIIAFGLGIGSVIAALLIPSHPIFMIVSIIMLMIFMIILPVLSNAFQTFEETTTFASAATNFGYMTLIMNNLPLFGLIFGVLIMIALYVRWQGGGQA